MLELKVLLEDNEPNRKFLSQSPLYVVITANWEIKNLARSIKTSMAGPEDWILVVEVNP